MEVITIGSMMAGSKGFTMCSVQFVARNLGNILY